MKSSSVNVNIGKIQANCESILEGKCQSHTFYEKDSSLNEPRNRYCWEATPRIYFLYIFLPSLMGWYAYAISFFSCMNHNPDLGGVSLFWSISGTWLAGYLLLCLRHVVYIPYLQFCSKSHLDNHKLLHWSIFLIYASILFSYELYAYTLNEIAAMAVFVFWILYIILYVILFLESHVRPCPSYGEKNPILKGWGNKIFLSLTSIIHIGFAVCAFVFNSQLQASSWRQTKACGTGTCECLS